MRNIQTLQEELISLLYSQVVDLSMMSRIELGDDVISKYQELTSQIKEAKSKKQEYVKGKVIAVDFDGVIHGYSNGWQDGLPYDKPVEGAKESLFKLIEQGYHVMIYTTRCNHDLLDTDRDRAQDVEDYLNRYGIPFSEIYTGNGKPKFMVTIDDRAISFKGNWSEVLEQVHNFKTWNRPEAKSSAEM